MKITIFCGGPSSEHEVSLKSAQTIFTTLKDSSYDISVLYITRTGRGYLCKPQSSLIREFSKVSIVELEPLDVVLRKYKKNIGTALLAGIHGEFAEDGQLQALLDTYDIPFTGSSASASALCIDKYKTLSAVKPISQLSIPKMLLIKAGAQLIPKRDSITFSFPVILKPNSLGSSVGISICTSYRHLCSQIKKLQKDYPAEDLLVTEYISGGVEVTCGCLEKKNGVLIPLPPVEIVPQDHPFFDYASKYDAGGAKELIPPPSLSSEMSDRISQLACSIHTTLGCSTYSRSDFIIKDSCVYFLETNTLPGFTRQSLFPQETAAIGMSLKETLDFIIKN